MMLCQLTSNLSTDVVRFFQMFCALFLRKTNETEKKQTKMKPGLAKNNARGIQLWLYLPLLTKPENLVFMKFHSADKE